MNTYTFIKTISIQLKSFRDMQIKAYNFDGDMEGDIFWQGEIVYRNLSASFYTFKGDDNSSNETWTSIDTKDDDPALIMEVDVFNQVITISSDKTEAQKEIDTDAEYARRNPNDADYLSNLVSRFGRPAKLNGELSFDITKEIEFKTNGHGIGIDLYTPWFKHLEEQVKNHKPSDPDQDELILA